MKILVGMSGGVDSSYAAMKLMAQGHEVEGAILVMHEYVDISAARMAAAKIGIPLHIIDCREEFDRVVRSSFINEYRNGRTPNPCIVCNPKIKFRALYDYALCYGFDRIATGHYARVVVLKDGGHAIAVAADEKKDQSYMLYRLTQDILSVLVLPLGESRKEDIRAEISDAGLSDLNRKDSQEICFIPDGDYASYIEAETGISKKGDFVDADGKVIGRHEGIIRYTLGQRKGLGVSMGVRAFVTDIDPINNRITLAPSPAMTKVFTVRDLVLSPCFTDGEYDVKIRYAAGAVRGGVKLVGTLAAEVDLTSSAKSVTPGQSAVFYKDGVVLGGGIIERL